MMMSAGIEKGVKVTDKIEEKRERERGRVTL